MFPCHLVIEEVKKCFNELHGLNKKEKYHPASTIELEKCKLKLDRYLRKCDR